MLPLAPWRPLRQFALALFLAPLLTLPAPAARAANLDGGSVAPAAAAGLRVPILMYHYVRVNPNPRDLVGADLSVPPARFAEQMGWLVAHGFHTITLDDLWAALEAGAPLPSRPVILTFDDGYEDFYTNAYPVLARLGLKAASFVITGRVGWLGYLTWDQIRAMQATGVAQFEAHTVDHLPLGRLPWARAQYELQAGKQALEQALGRPVSYICYPSGDYTPAVERLAAADGYRAGLTTHAGVMRYPGDLLALPRVRVHGAERLATFAALLGGRPAAQPPPGR